METDAECAAQRAARIVETNEERKERTRSMTKQAAEEVQKQPLPPVLVVYLQECHESVAGIVSRKSSRTILPTGVCYYRFRVIT